MVGRNTVLCVGNDNGLDFVPIMVMNSLSDLVKDTEAKKVIVYLSPDGKSGNHSNSFIIQVSLPVNLLVHKT